MDSIKKRYYTGVGHRSKNVYPEGKDFILWLAAEMDLRGLDLLSGDADGTDHFFESKCNDNCIIYLPDEKFGHYPGRNMATRYVLDNEEKEYADEMLYSLGILPEIKTMAPYNKKYHRRNFFQSWNFGDLPEVCFYYAKENPDGTIEGGTRTAVYTARHFGIPCYNLYTEAGRQLVKQLLEAGTWD